MSWYLEVLKKYAQFDGRAARTEFWMFCLINAIIMIVLQAAASQVGILSLIATLYSLAVLVPALAVGARRLHDTGRSGWWQLLSFVPIIGVIVLIVFWIQAGAPGENQYGANPLEGNPQTGIDA
jgi:uncharacterized membrane protein YhaH (DUF805 family)